MSASTFHSEHPAPTAYRAAFATDSRLGPGGLRPTLTTTVPKELVHRAAVAEVMLTDWRRESGTIFRMEAQWPRSHSFFTPIDGEYYDPLMISETIRQAGYLLAHAEFGVPLDHQFLLWDLELSVHPEHLQVRQAPASLDIEVICTEVKFRGNGNLAVLRYETLIRRDGHLVATGGASGTGTTPATYQRLRAKSAPAGDRQPLPLTAPMAPQSVGRTSPVDVVLSPVGETDRWQLRVDTRHPVLFDHPVDHVPGMLLIEAARQASAAVLGRTSLLPLSVSGEFLRYVELDAPCEIRAALVPNQLPAGRHTVLVTAHQNGEPCFSATVTASRQQL